MSSGMIVICIAVYFAVLLTIAWFTGRFASSDDYFIGSRKSPWYVLAFGLIGDSLSGVTFISLPGTIAASHFSYMQMVAGYVLGYWAIAYFLLPVYYRLHLTSIYAYLRERFGKNAQISGSFFFLISRLAGAALRLYLAAGVIQIFVCDSLHIPFSLTVSGIIVLMLIYTLRGGIRTLIWTDLFQSGLLLLGVVLSIYSLMHQLDFSLSDAVKKIYSSEYSQFIYTDWREKTFFFKQFISGAFIAIVMTGLDQNMMQKNLSCHSLPDAQKNLYTFSFIVVIVNLFFVSMGALLFIYAGQKGIQLPMSESGKIIGDKVFPTLAFNHLGTMAAIVFIVGLTAATFNSADSVLTTLTTSFCMDFLDMKENSMELASNVRKRYLIHIGFGILLLVAILLCSLLSNTSVLDAIFTTATYTYGPLLGLFAFGLFTKRNFADTKAVIAVCVISPIISWILHDHAAQWFNGYQFGYELLLINGFLTFVGLSILSALKRNETSL